MKEKTAAVIAAPMRDYPKKRTSIMTWGHSVAMLGEYRDDWRFKDALCFQPQCGNAPRYVASYRYLRHRQKNRPHEVIIRRPMCADHAEVFAVNYGRALPISAAETGPLFDPELACEICGCTNSRACLDPSDGSPCYWVRPGLCSVCVDRREKGRAEHAAKRQC